MTRLLPASLVLLLALVPAGCSGGTDLARDVAMSAGFVGGEPKPAPDFITRSRPGETDYIPTGTPSARTGPRKTAADVGRAEAEMEALRRKNEARGNAARKAASP